MIVVVGEALVDLVIDPAGAVAAALGGAPDNTARACGRLGVDVAFAGSLSVDRFGSLLAARLVDDGVDTAHAPRVELPTTLAAAEIDERGAASYRFYVADTSAPALTHVPAVGPDDIVFAGGLGLVFDPMADTVERCITTAPEATIVVIDVNCRPLTIADRDAYVARVRRVLRRADVVKVSDEDLAYLSPGAPPLDAARALLVDGPQVVLVTAGGDAVHVLTAEASVSVPVPAVEVIDTIGAGDSFGGGFLSWWVLNGHGRAELADVGRVERAVAAAVTVAGVACTRRGADPPWRRELPSDWSS